MPYLVILIDPQNDFCSPDGTLFVPGASDDVFRMAQIVSYLDPKQGDQVMTTQDWHAKHHLANALFWRVQTSNISGLDEWKVIRAQLETCYQSHIFPSDISFLSRPHDITFASVFAIESSRDHVFVAILPGEMGYVIVTPNEDSRIAKIFNSFEKTKDPLTGKKCPITLWPDHCIVEDGKPTKGATIHPELEAALDSFRKRGGDVCEVMKGDDVNDEQFSAFKANSGEVNTKNAGFLKTIQTFKGKILVCGEAGSHCVRYTFHHIYELLSKQALENLYLVEGTMSPVKDCEDKQRELFQTYAKNKCTFIHLIDKLKTERGVRNHSPSRDVFSEEYHHTNHGLHSVNDLLDHYMKKNREKESSDQATMPKLAHKLACLVYAMDRKSNKYYVHVRAASAKSQNNEKDVRYGIPIFDANDEKPFFSLDEQLKSHFKTSGVSEMLTYKGMICDKTMTINGSSWSMSVFAYECRETQVPGYMMILIEDLSSLSLLAHELEILARWSHGATEDVKASLIRFIKGCSCCDTCIFGKPHGLTCCGCGDDSHEEEEDIDEDEEEEESDNDTSEEEEEEEESKKSVSSDEEEEEAESDRSSEKSSQPKISAPIRKDKSSMFEPSEYNSGSEGNGNEDLLDSFQKDVRRQGELKHKEAAAESDRSSEKPKIQASIRKGKSSMFDPNGYGSGSEENGNEYLLASFKKDVRRQGGLKQEEGTRRPQKAVEKDSDSESSLSFSDEEEEVRASSNHKRASSIGGAEDITHRAERPSLGTIPPGHVDHLRAKFEPREDDITFDE